MSWLSDLDDDDDKYADFEAKERPNPKRNRPRTKIRPEHSDAVPGRVLTVDRGRYTVLIDEDGAEERAIISSRASELRKQAIVTGDIVDVVGDTSGAPGSLARIVRIQPRKTMLRRSADDSDEVERIIVANADQMLIVVAAADPEPRPRLVDRYLVAAFDAGISPILCITKTDLANPTEFLKNFEPLDVTVVTSGFGAMPTEQIKTLLAGHTTVAVGHSGVGKSTLVNALVPEAHRATGQVNLVTGRGRHTSSSTVSYRVAGGWIVDTPGVRSFGLGHVNVDNVLKSFTDLAAISDNCPRGCTHLPEAPNCELNIHISAGELGEVGRARLISFQRLLTSLS